MRYTQMLSSVLALLLILTATAYAAPTAEDIPEWALRPALEAVYNKHVLERARHESEGAGALQYEIVKEIIYYE